MRTKWKSQERPQRQILLHTWSFKKAWRIHQAITDTRESRPKPDVVHGYPLCTPFHCWKTFPKIWTAYRKTPLGIIRGPWKRHFLLPPWTVGITRWPKYEEWGFRAGTSRDLVKRGEGRVVSRQEHESFVEQMKKPWINKES